MSAFTLVIAGTIATGDMGVAGGISGNIESTADMVTIVQGVTMVNDTANIAGTITLATTETGSAGAGNSNLLLCGFKTCQFTPILPDLTSSTGIPSRTGYNCTSTLFGDRYEL